MNAIFSESVNLADDDFTLLALPQQYALDLSVLSARWKVALAATHPDRFSQAGAAGQRLAMQWSVRLNEAYQRLKHPLKRAEYLCALRGSPVNAERNTAMPAAFLMQQMELREALDEASDWADLHQIKDHIERLQYQAYRDCELALDVEHSAENAAKVVRVLMFLDKFSHDLKKRWDAQPE